MVSASDIMSRFQISYQTINHYTDFGLLPVSAKEGNMRLYEREIVEKRLRKGRVVAEILKQDNDQPVPMEEQIMVLYALSTGAMDQLMPDHVRDYQSGLIAQIRAKRPDAVQELMQKKDLTPMVKEGFDEQIAAYRDGRV